MASAPPCSLHTPMPSLCSAIVGELDEHLDSRVELADVRAPPLKPIAH